MTMAGAACATVIVASLAGIVPAGAATVEVTIEKMHFMPAEITVQAGDTVKWTNKDFVGHSATATDKSFDIVVPASGSGTLVVKAPGTVDYYCRFHPMMKGKITAQGG
jgi:plastocyanin